MNNIFLKNLLIIGQKNPILAKKLEAYIPNELPKLVQENGAYNLFYKENFIHNVSNPLREAQEIFAQAENTPVSIHLVYGIGLGYLFQVASLNSKGTVILYEPDLNVLWLALTLVDFSADILKSNVFITTEFDEVSQAIYKKSGMKNSPLLLFLPSQKKYNPEAFDGFVKQIKDVIGSFSLDLKYTKNNLYPALLMLINNIPKLYKEIPLAKFKDVYKGKTALIVSAGPTLDRNIEIIKKYRKNFVLFTVGTAVKTLYSNDIKPDFLCIIETYNSSRQVEGLDLSDVNFVTEPYSNPALREFKFKNIYSHISANSPTNHFWAEICGENIEEYWSKGTVSYTALNCARLLGCSKIILVGQDLAYIEGQCYSKDSAYKDLSCSYNEESARWEIVAKDFEKFADAISPSPNIEERKLVALDRLKNLNSSLYYVKGIQGDMIPTESVYAAFVKPLQEYVRHFNDKEYINTSLVGAQIDGFKNIGLEEALKGSSPVGNIELNEKFSYNKSLIVETMNSKLVELKDALDIIKNGKLISKNIKNEITRHRSINADILKLLKKVSTNYLELSGDFANKSKMFDFIVIEDKINLDYEMKMMQEFTVESVLRINGLLSEFYEKAEKKILEVERLVNESINSTC